MMVVLDACVGMNDTLFTGCMKYLTLDPRYGPREFKTLASTDGLTSIVVSSNAKQKFCIYKVLMGHYLCE